MEEGLHGSELTNIAFLDPKHMPSKTDSSEPTPPKSIKEYLIRYHKRK